MKDIKMKQFVALGSWVAVETKNIKIEPEAVEAPPAEITE